jgi:hypothetical protein
MTSRDGVFSGFFLLPVEIPLAVAFPFGYAKEISLYGFLLLGMGHSGTAIPHI